MTEDTGFPESVPEPPAAPAPEPPAPEADPEPAPEAPQEPGWLRDVADSYPIVGSALREILKLLGG